MKRLTLLLLVLGSACHAVFSQETDRKRPYSVYGNILDKGTGAALELVTVSLLDADGRAVSSSVSHPDGRFIIRCARKGDFRLYASMVGYKPYIKNITLTDEALDAGNILLEQGLDIEEVVVAVKPLIRYDADRIIYDVSADPEAGKVKCRI